MAFLRRHPNSPYWNACFIKPDGRYTNRSTKLKDRRAAQKVADSWEDAGRNRLAENQARHVISDIFKTINGTSLVTPTFSQYREVWLARKAVETKPTTLLHYKGALADLERHLQRKAQEPLNYVTPADITAWRDEVAARTSARNANNRLKVARVIFGSAWRESLILDNPAAKARTLRVAESNRRPFTFAEVEAVWKVATGEWKGIITFGLYTGQRLRDIALLTWGNVDRVARMLKFTTCKTGRYQQIPITPPVQAYLDTLPASDDPRTPLFPHAYAVVISGKSTSTLSGQFHEIMAKAGLTTPRPLHHAKTSGNGRSAKRVMNPLTFHSLRHSTTSMLKACGVPESIVRDIIGHESAIISRHYTHVTADQKREAVEKMPTFSEVNARSAVA